MEELIKATMTALSAAFIIGCLWLMARDMKRQEEEDETPDHRCEWCGAHFACTRLDCPLARW